MKSTQLRDSRAVVEPVEEDRTIVDGDWAEISYNGRVSDDAEAAPIHGEDSLVEVGGKDTVDAFTQCCVAPKPGQELKAEVIYPRRLSRSQASGQDRCLRCDRQGHQEADPSRAQ